MLAISYAGLVTLSSTQCGRGWRPWGSQTKWALSVPRTESIARISKTAMTTIILIICYGRRYIGLNMFADLREFAHRGFVYTQTEPSVFVVQVRMWPWAKPMDVALEALELWDGDVPTYNQQMMGEKDFKRYQEQERKAVQDAPRDEKGRFVRQ